MVFSIISTWKAAASSNRYYGDFISPAHYADGSFSHAGAHPCSTYATDGYCYTPAGCYCDSNSDTDGHCSTRAHAYTAPCKAECGGSNPPRTNYYTDIIAASTSCRDTDGASG